MSIFQSLRSLLKRKPLEKDAPMLPQGLAYWGITEGDLVYLADLVTDERWAIFLKALDNAVKLKGEAILGASSADSLFSLRGEVLGLRAAANLPTEILRKSKELRESDARRIDPAKQRADARTIATWGTAAFNDR